MPRTRPALGAAAGRDAAGHDCRRAIFALRPERHAGAGDTPAASRRRRRRGCCAQRATRCWSIRVLEIRRLPRADARAGRGRGRGRHQRQRGAGAARPAADLPVFAVGEATAGHCARRADEPAGIAGGDGTGAGRADSAGGARRRDDPPSLRPRGARGPGGRAGGRRLSATGRRSSTRRSRRPQAGADDRGRNRASAGWTPCCSTRRAPRALFAAGRQGGRARSSDLADVLAACLSEAVAAELAGLPFGSVRVADARDQKALLRCLEG